MAEGPRRRTSAATASVIASPATSRIGAPLIPAAATPARASGKLAPVATYTRPVPALKRSRAMAAAVSSSTGAREAREVGLGQAA